MTISTVTRNIYITSDGEEFIDERDAKKHELSLQLESLFDDIGICQGGEWSASMVMEAMRDYQKEFKQVFNIL